RGLCPPCGGCCGGSCFFFSSRRRHTRFSRDWSSDVCSSDLTQIDPDGFWFRCPLEVQQAAWPTEDYHLARSVVDSELPEDGLFEIGRASCRERVSVRAVTGAV